MECRACGLEMDGASCIATLDGHARVKYEGTEYEGPIPCGDCGVLPDGYHHADCDMEECPVCGGLLLSCGGR